MDRREQRFKKRTAVTKEQALNFLYANEAADQNREAHRCDERNSNGITQPSGAATPRNSDAHERIAVPQALCVLRERPDQGLKAAKFAVLIPGPTGFPNRAKRSEGSNSAPIRNTPVSPCVPLCAIFLRKASVYSFSGVKANVGRLCECDLKPLRRGLSNAIWDAPSAYFRQIRRLAEDLIYSRIKGWRRKRRRSRHFCPQCGQLTGVSTQSVVASIRKIFCTIGV